MHCRSQEGVERYVLLSLRSSQDQALPREGTVTWEQ